MPAGSCRGIYSRPHRRHEPLHHSCKMGYSYAQGYSVSLSHPGRASTLLKSSSEICFRISVGCRLCGILDRYRGWEVRVGYTVGIIWDFVYVNSILLYVVLFFCPAQVGWSKVFLVLHFSTQPR